MQDEGPNYPDTESWWGQALRREEYRCGRVVMVDLEMSVLRRLGLYPGGRVQEVEIIAPSQVQNELPPSGLQRASAAIGDEVKNEEGWVARPCVVRSCGAGKGAIWSIPHSAPPPVTTAGRINADLCCHS